MNIIQNLDIISLSVIFSLLIKLKSELLVYETLTIKRVSIKTKPHIEAISQKEKIMNKQVRLSQNNYLILSVLAMNKNHVTHNYSKN